MSLVIAYHDKNRAVVVSDDRGITFDADGPHASSERFPKFCFVGPFILAVTGASDVCDRVKKAFAKMYSDYPHTSDITAMAQCLPVIVKGIFESRIQQEGQEAKLQSVETLLVGWDPRRNKIRSFGTRAPFFELAETTENAFNRIACLGAADAPDFPILESLTMRMRLAGMKKLPWVAAELRDAMQTIHERRPGLIGRPSFYAALDGDAILNLPENLPPLPEVEALAVAGHQASIVKTDALYGSGVMFLGSILTPTAGGVETIGNNDGGTGGTTTGMLNQLLFSEVTTNTTGTGSVTDPNNSIDGDSTTYTTLSLSATSTGANAFDLVLSAVPGITRGFEGYILQIRLNVTTNTLNTGSGVFQINYAYNGAVVSNLLTLNAGATLTTQTLTLGIDAGLNPSLVQIQVAGAVAPPTTSGTLTAHIFEAALVGLEG